MNIKTKTEKLSTDKHVITINYKGDATDVTSPLFISSAERAIYQRSKNRLLALISTHKEDGTRTMFNNGIHERTVGME